MQLFLSLEHLETTVGLLTGPISILCLSIGRPGKKETSRGAASQWSWNTCNIYRLSSLSYVVKFKGPQNNYKSNIKGH